MANELHFVGTPAQTGLTVVARVYDNLGAQVGGDVACAEATTTAIYVGDMPATGAGKYIVRFVDSAENFLAAGDIDWDGAQEVFNTNLKTDIAALNNFDPATDTVARVTLVDTTTANADMRGTDGAVTSAGDATAAQQTAILSAISGLNDLSSTDVTAALATYDAPTKAELDAAEADIIAAIGSSGGLTAAQTTQLNELWQIRGLDPANPVTVTTVDEVSGSIDIEVTGDGKTTSTLTRQ